GATWSQLQTMMGDVPGCAQSNDFVAGGAVGPGGMLYLLTNHKNQLFLSAWNGAQWSQPQVQPILAGFEEPETYAPVTLGCHQATWLGEQLYVVGCDTSSGGDIWVTSQQIASAASWFSPDVWSGPASITSDALEVTNVVVASTSDDLVH